MIRILLPRNTYNEHRIKLVERLTALQIRSYSGVRRAFMYLDAVLEGFLEGFLESEDKLKLVCEMLTDNPLVVEQFAGLDSTFSDMKTVLIEDAEELEGVPY